VAGVGELLVSQAPKAGPLSQRIELALAMVDCSSHGYEEEDAATDLRDLSEVVPAPPFGAGDPEDVLAGMPTQAS
jgi:hypothetical protein